VEGVSDRRPGEDEEAGSHLIIIGIDPGLDGAIAAIFGSHVGVRVMPTLQSSKSKRMIDEREVVRYLERRQDSIGHVFIERVGAMPGQGVTSCFTFGCGWGIIRGICAALHLPYTLVHPVTWKKVVCRDMSQGKDAAIIVAKRLWPDVSLRRSDRSKKDHDGMADALCIAEWGRRAWKEGLCER